MELSVQQKKQMEYIKQETQPVMQESASKNFQAPSPDEDFAALQQEERKQFLKEVFLVDLQSAEALKEAYPELVEEARQEETKLQREANVKGMEKVKNDFFASKKRAARTRLSQISQQRNAREKKREESMLAHTRQLAESYGTKCQERQADLESRLASIQEQLSALEGTLTKEQQKQKDDLLAELQKVDKQLAYIRYSPAKDDGAIARMERLLNSGDANQIRNEKTNEFLEKKLIWSPDGMKSYDSNAITRDLTMFVSPFKEQDKADSEEMVRAAHASYILKNKKLPTEEGNPPATAEQQKAAYDLFHGYVKRTYDAILAYQESHPELFRDHIRLEDAMDNIEDIRQWYKQTQVVTYATRDMKNSDVFPTLTKEEQ
ncbi:MAG: hypothetical protein IJU50_10835, partial [Lachnospiraceae bacterium]|nr:hypothetical protein [Lachnospiraceae bacterium]